MTKTDFLKKLSNQLSDDDFDSIVLDEDDDTISSFVDTGSYAYNALVSGSIYGGIPGNRVTTLAGESSTGKSYLLLSMVKNFLDTFEGSFVFFFESEYALSKKDFVKRGIDPSRVNLNRVDTVEAFKDKAYKSVKYLIDQFPDPSTRPRVMLCLDSLGYLSTTKELKDADSGKESADMTRARAIRSAFRVLLKLLGVNNIPFVLTTHIYDTMSPFSPTAINGGKSVYYASTLILSLRKSLSKDGKEVIGSIVKMTTEKSRLTKEKQTVETVINFDGGLDRYHGLVDLAIESGAIEYNGRQFIIDGKKVWGKTIASNPEQYFTKEVLDKIDTYCQKKYLYDSQIDIDVEN